MKDIFRNLLVWIILLELSIIVSYGFKWTDQGKAFCYITLSFVIIIALFEFVGLLILRENADTKSIIQTVDIVCFTLLFICAIWGAAKFFKIDFFLAFQFATLGLCFCPNNEKITSTDVQN